MVKVWRWISSLVHSQLVNFAGWIIAGLVFLYLGAHDMLAGRALYGRFHPTIMTPQSHAVFF
jgi:hypothetical protein